MSAQPGLDLLLIYSTHTLEVINHSSLATKPVVTNQHVFVHWTKDGSCVMMKQVQIYFKTFRIDASQI